MNEPPPGLRVVPADEGARRHRSYESHGTWIGLGAALAFGLVVDRLAEGPPGLGTFIAAVAGFGFFASIARPRPATLPFFVGGLVLAAFPVFRANLLLGEVDLACAVGLFGLGAGFAREGAPSAASLREYVVRAFAWVPSVQEGMASLAGPPLRAIRGEGERSWSLPRLVAIVAPAVGVFGVLLGSADPVYAHFLRAPIAAVPLGDAPLHVAMVCAGALALATLLARGVQPVSLGRAAEPLRPRFELALREWQLLLGAVDLLFAGFVAVQFAYFFGGRTRVLDQEGLTFAQYARTGFAQLLVAAMLSGLLLAFAWLGGRPAAANDRRAYAWLGGVMIVLVLAVLVSAFRRLTLYEDAFGFTWPRLLGHAAVVFVAVLLASGLLAIATRRLRRLPAAALALGFATIVGLNAINPDLLIAERNLDRWRAGHELDVIELSSLSPDAVPALVAALPELRARARNALASHLACQRDRLAEDVDRFGWTSFNGSRDAALDALDGTELGPCAGTDYAPD